MLPPFTHDEIWPPGDFGLTWNAFLDAWLVRGPAAPDSAVDCDGAWHWKPVDRLAVMGRLRFLCRPFENEPDFKATSVNDDLRKLPAAGRPLS